MLYNEERPHNFDQMVGQKHIVENIRNQSKENRWFQVYILAGQFGGGKTTMSRIIALASNCSSKDENGNPCLVCENCISILNGTTTDILEIDAASNNGVDFIRDLKEGTEYKPFNLNKKIYIIDEVHMLSKGAFNALLKLLEEPPSHTMFIMCTTDLKAIPATVRSRSAIYIFEQISFNDIYEKLECVVSERSFNITHDALVLIAKNAQGSMRNAYSLLQQATSGNKDKVEAEDVQMLLGISDPTYLFDLLLNIIKSEPGKCVLSLEKAVALGKDMSLMINDMIDIVANAVIAKSASMDLIHETEQYKSLLSNIVENSYIEQLCHIADGLMDIRVNLRKCPDKTTVAVGIIRITSSSINASFIARLEKLENMFKSGQKVACDISLSGTENVKSSTDDVYISNVEEAVSEDYCEVDMAAGIDLSAGESNELENELEAGLRKDKVDSENSSMTFPYDEPEKEFEDDTKDNLEEQSNDCDEEIVETKCSDNDEFDVFSLFENFNCFTSHVSSSESEGEDFKNIGEIDQSARQRQLEERLKLVTEGDSVFMSAMMGCIKTMQDGMLVLETPLKPVYDIINAYLSASEIEDVKVKHDPLIALSC